MVDAVAGSTAQVCGGVGRALLLIKVGFDDALLEQTLQYYGSQGFDQLFLCVHESLYLDAPAIAKVTMLAKEYDVTVTDFCCRVDMSAEACRLLMRESYCDDDDWLFLATSREFHQYGLPPKELVWLCMEKRTDCIAGTRIDRFGRYGDFPSIDDSPVWDRFPLALSLAEKIQMKSPSLLVGGRVGNVFPDDSHIISAGTDGYPVEARVNVHDFEWDEGAVDRQRRAMCDYALDQDPRCIAAFRLLRYLDGKTSVDAMDDHLEPFWPSYRRAIPASRGSSKDPAQVLFHSSDFIFSKPLGVDEVELVDGSDFSYLYHRNKDMAIRLTARGRDAWEMIDGRRTMIDLVHGLVQGFDVGCSVEKGVQYFAKKLLDLEAIKFV